MPVESSWLRKAIEQRAEQGRPRGRVEERGSPVYPAGTRGPEQRSQARYEDITGATLYGLGALWNTSTW